MCGVCTYFQRSVLPTNPALQSDVNEKQKGKREGTIKQCAQCGKPFLPASNRQRYCEACRIEAERKRNAANHRTRYWNGKSK